MADITVNSMGLFIVFATTIRNILNRDFSSALNGIFVSGIYMEFKVCDWKMPELSSAVSYLLVFIR